MDAVTINNKPFPTLEYKNQRVVTFEMIDEVHERVDGAARGTFKRNRSRFIEGVDTYVIDYSEKGFLSPFGIDVPPRGLRVFTESGYLMIVKSFNDDLAWQVQRELVNSYFRIKQLIPEHSPLKSKAEILAEMAQMHLEHERRINAVNSQVAEVSAQVSMVAETLEQIKKGNIPEGYIGYRQLAAKCGLTEAKCRNLVNAFRIPTDTHEFLTPDGLLARRSIVALAPFRKAFKQVMSEAEPRNKRWYHPKMGMFQAIHHPVPESPKDNLSLHTVREKIRTGYATVCRRSSWPEGIWVWPEGGSRKHWRTIRDGKIHAIDLAPEDIVATDWIVS
ncbi:TPA: ORF6N domain-containing protein [Escherichia coli]|uniref:ORF6N domain-containing protein n=1 Tax=Escherichia coli TaxID=562 RepID=UPI0030FFB5C1|nr:ORF6N domain-containing protein [Escherichia coli]HCS0243212.1 ORF6N domain-containing protein [Escherichia coli]